ncbi:MAG: tyrosine-type recombinase/integrase [Dehalococcoidia bacterium]
MQAPKRLSNSTARRKREKFISWHEPHQMWRVRVRIPGRVLKAVYFPADALAEAIEYRDRVIYEAHRSDPTEPGGRTVAWLVQRWLTYRKFEVENGELALNTYRDYERLVRLHIVPSELGGARLRDNLVPHIGDLMVKKNGLKASYRRRLLVVLRQAFDLGVSENVLPRNYAKEVRPPRSAAPRPDAWTEQEARTFLEKSKGSPLAVLWLFLLHTGARMGEACGLRWEDVDLDEQPATVAFVQQRLRAPKGQPKFGRLKTERSTRTIAIDAVLAARLREHKDATSNLRALSGTDLVFLSQTATPLDTPNVGRRWRADVAASGVRYLKPHGTRSTHATITARRGARLEEVSRRLGHSTTAFTADVYYKSGGSAALAPALFIAEALAAGEIVAEIGSSIGSECEEAPTQAGASDSN